VSLQKYKIQIFGQNMSYFVSTKKEKIGTS